MVENAESGRFKNYRNGYLKKTVKTRLGKVNIKVSRDRNSEYEPQIIECIDSIQRKLKKRIPAS